MESNGAAPVSGRVFPASQQLAHARETGVPARLHLIMGQQCNVHCVMCYQTKRSGIGNMPPELYVERLGEAYPSVQAVKLQGGEPTIMRNCREVGALLRGLPHVRISLATNGIRLGGFWSDLLLSQGESVDISLNAATEASYRKIVPDGDFAAVVAHVRALARARRGGWPRLGLALVVLKENFFELRAFMALAAELGVDAVKLAVDPILSFAGLPSPSIVKAELERLEARQYGLEVVGLERLRRQYGLATGPRAVPERGGCQLPFQQAVIDTNGDVRLCVGTWSPVGNLYRASLAEIWRGPAASRLRERVACGDFSTCEASCPHNLLPSRTALIRKYASYCTRDPGFFVRKLRQKVRQLRRA